MEYMKPSLSFIEQAELLLSRGLVANKDDLVRYLNSVNYYRLSGYLWGFRENGPGESFIIGTTLKDVQQRYVFDRQLRIIIFEAIEKIEVAVFRSQLVEFLASKYGPFCFAERTSFKPINFHQKNSS